ncbi:unnamed protein product [Brachionus calyciflorus]|uniref:Uncharacterized protein n=1 Tax=Brachionus calyciflorus TaxID=104777 RepID=A0A813RTW8_9BILA|nr:unnamed protein product [Brachionus calyciflorus]
MYSSYFTIKKFLISFTTSASSGFKAASILCKILFISYSDLRVERNIGYYPNLDVINKLKIPILYKNEYYSPFLVTSIDENDLERTTLMVNIYYVEMYYTVIDDSEAMNFETLFGGYLGLINCISVLTFEEIIETIFYIGYIFVLRYAQHNEKQEQNNF